MNKNIFLYFLLSIFGIISILNLFHAGFPVTHDGDVHLLRLTNFYQSLQEGNLIPRWAANVNYGYGQPVFEFFYPLPYYIASIFHFFGMSFADAIKVVLGISLLGSGYTMYLWLSKITSRNGAFLGGMLYIFAPFRFVDVYVRGDIGESLAFVFVPLVFYFFLQISQKVTYKRILLGGVSLALLILCHNVISLMMLPFILWYGIFLLYQKKRKSLFIALSSILLIGFCLSAFFWIPGLIEGRFTLRNIVTAGEYKGRFITLQQLLYGPWSYAGSGLFTVQLGLIHWIIFILSMLSIPLLVIKRNKNVIFVLSLLIFNCIGIFLMFPNSNFIWEKILLLQNFQFPWRFLAIPVFALSVLAAYLYEILPKRISFWVLAGSICAILFVNRGYWYATSFVNRPDNYFAGIQKHPADTGESTPIWGIRFMEQNYEAPLEVITGRGRITQTRRTTTDHKYIIDAKTPVRLLENTLYFPGWEVILDGNPVVIQFQDQQYRGLMTFNARPGKHTIEVIFKDTKLRILSDMLSIFTFSILIIFAVIQIWRKK